MTSTTDTLAFIGAGNMASAIIAGVIRAGLYPPDRIIASDLRPQALAQLQEAHGIQVQPDSQRAAAAAQTVVLAVKPQTFASLLPSLHEQLGPPKLVVSIAAGVPLSVIEQALPAGAHVVRVMPNTPALVGCGASALAAGTHASAADVATVERVFAAVGLAETVDEAQLDAVTALSGSGPAYVFRMIEALVDGATAAGLPRPQAERLATQTVLGAAQLAAQSDEDAATLRARVTSPGGTTAAGLAALQAAGFHAAVQQCIAAATARGKELGEQARSAAAQTDR